MSGISTFLLLALSLQYLLWSAKCDVYLHNPRGSNNRLDGEGTNRRNANRVFDSQNNAKGGYNTGEKTEKKTKDWHEMEHIMSGSKLQDKSILTIEWTNQHGCGDGDLNCNLILQYKCQPESVSDKQFLMRDGTSTGTPRYSKRYYNSKNEKDNAANSQVKIENVLNEAWEWYDKCNKRERNKGLFTADQMLRGDTSRYTRQNRNGNQHGYECPEERDHYPYWHPTDWIDTVVFANKEQDCEYYKAESFNVKPKGECMEQYPDDTWKHASKYNNPSACRANGGRWTEFSQFLHILPEHKTEASCKGASTTNVPLIWAIPYRSEYLDKLDKDPEKWQQCLAKPPALDCKEAPRSRPNHLGNGEGVVPLTYDWVLPHIHQSKKKEDYFRCVLRMRYNISTDDYNTSSTFAESNEQSTSNLITNQSPIDNDPVVDVGQDEVPLQLAINTAQFGRTFQDRSHVFRLHSRSESVEKNCKAIYNINVRGKRGNIVQVYPAVEYDFVPKRLSISKNDCVFMAWAGSNKNPGGNDGEGKRQTDRSNIVEMENPALSYPLTSLTPSMFENAKVINWRSTDETTDTAEDMTIALASGGEYMTKQAFLNYYNTNNYPKNPESRTYTQYAQLDFNPASFPGLLMKIAKGTYNYMCTRNNNFSNRSQKGRLVIT